MAATLQLYVDDKSLRIQILFLYGRIKFIQPEAALFFLAVQMGRPYICAALGLHIYFYKLWYKN